MKVIPKLSAEQLQTLDRLVASEAKDVARAKTSARGASPKMVKVSSTEPMFSVDDRVELCRSVPGTQYRAGQRGTVVALHGYPPKVAEVEIPETFYADVVNIGDLKRLA